MKSHVADVFPEFVFSRGHDGARDDIAMAIQILRRRMHDEVGAMPNGLRQYRCGDRGVDDECRASVVRDIGGSGNVDHVPGRIAGRLDPEQFRLSSLDRSHQGVRVRRIE